MIRKYFVLMLTILLAITLLSSCSSDNTPSGTPHTSENNPGESSSESSSISNSEGSSQCVHIWVNATCTAPKHCSLCQTTEGNVLEHTGGTATCSQRALCDLCGVEYGDLKPHTYTTASCTEAKTCSVCHKSEGAATGHSWIDATCTKAKYCSVCKTTEGAPIDHDWLDPTCDEPFRCSSCNATDGKPLGHEYEITSTVQPTYSTPGKNTYTCIYCQTATYDEAIPILSPDILFREFFTICRDLGPFASSSQVPLSKDPAQFVYYIYPHIWSNAEFSADGYENEDEELVTISYYKFKIETLDVYSFALFGEKFNYADIDQIVITDSNEINDYIYEFIYDGENKTVTVCRTFIGGGWGYGPEAGTSYDFIYNGYEKVSNNQYVINYYEHATVMDDEGGVVDEYDTGSVGKIYVELKGDRFAITSHTLSGRT